MRLTVSRCVRRCAAAPLPLPALSRVNLCVEGFDAKLLVSHLKLMALFHLILEPALDRLELCLELPALRGHLESIMLLRCDLLLERVDEALLLHYSLL